MEINIDARRLSRSWLSVYEASERRSGYAPPSMVRTVHIEAYEDRGVRLMGTDGSLLLYSWVPFMEWEPEPGPEDPVDLVATAHDVDDRLAGLMSYLVKLTNPKAGDDEPPEIEVKLTLMADVDDGEHRLDGLAPKWVTLNYPGREIVRVRAMEVVQPDWRAAMHDYHPDATYEITMNPHDMRRVAKVAQWVPGPFRAQFQGETGAMRLLWPKAEPLHMTGMVLPVRNWKIIAHEPEKPPTPELDELSARAIEELRESGLLGNEVTLDGKRFLVTEDGEIQPIPEPVGPEGEQLSALEELARAAAEGLDVSELTDAGKQALADEIARRWTVTIDPAAL